MAAYVIRTAPDLTASAAALAADLGPSMVRSTEPVENLMASAGFTDMRARDVTDALARSCEAILAYREIMEAELRAEEGDAAFEEERTTKEGMLAAVRRGLLRRTLIVGRSPATV